MNDPLCRRRRGVRGRSRPGFRVSQHGVERAAMTAHIAAIGPGKCGSDRRRVLSDQNQSAACASSDTELSRLPSRQRARHARLGDKLGAGRAVAPIPIVRERWRASRLPSSVGACAVLTRASRSRKQPALIGAPAESDYLCQCGSETCPFSSIDDWPLTCPDGTLAVA